MPHFKLTNQFKKGARAAGLLLLCGAYWIAIANAELQPVPNVIGKPQQQSELNAAPVFVTENTLVADSEFLPVPSGGTPAAVTLTIKEADTTDYGNDGLTSKYLGAEYINRNIHLSGLGGLGIKACYFFGKPQWMTTVNGDLILIDQAFIGLAIFRVVSSNVFRAFDQVPLGLSFTGGGVEGGYFYRFKEGIFLRGQILLGMTSVFYTDPFEPMYTANDIMIIEPGLYVGVHPLDWLHVSIGASYRWALGAEGREGFAADDFDSPAVEIRVEFGYY